MNLDGHTAAGAQTLSLTVGHLQLAAAPAISRVAVQVSFDNGRTWHSARVIGSGSSYRARHSAPARALVTLRVSASDAAGGTIEETIARAYGVA
jgi:hypothetical protein